MKKIRLLAPAAVMLCMLVLGGLLFSANKTPARAAGAALRLGDLGETVRTLQEKLKNWGYYNGSVDGIFGSKTESAVQYFQRRNGLTPDGVVGPATAEKLGLTLSGTSGNKNQGDVNLLARVVHGEARGEPYSGQVAVGAVVLNRVDNAQFPNSISGVVYQPYAFSVVLDGQINLTPNSEAIRAARDALNGYDPTSGCLYYYNPAKTTNKWMLSRPIHLRIGEHVFCR